MPLFESAEEKRKALLEKYDKKFNETVKAGIEARDKLVDFLTEDQTIIGTKYYTRTEFKTFHTKYLINKSSPKRAKKIADDIISMKRNFIREKFSKYMCLNPSSDEKSHGYAFSVEKRSNIKNEDLSFKEIKEVDAICSSYVKAGESLYKMDKFFGSDRLKKATKEIVKNGDKTDKNKEKEGEKKSETKLKQDTKEAVQKKMKER